MNKLFFGLEVMVIGFSVVYITLFVLNLIFKGFGIFFDNSSSKKMVQKEQEQKIKIERDKISVLEKRDKGEQEKEISPEILAVIACALAVYAERPGYHLKVRRVKRGKSPGSWIMAGRNDMINIYRRESV
ncbi:MAG: hypothetical protein CVU88_03560 [Firmicutes bacterium HGW-Firmicutes-13]|nr:MAG: hypothetical protein CVU88_03560 [Firmicutes bacterium HGW-Firmicutes-13]